MADPLALARKKPLTVSTSYASYEDNMQNSSLQRLFDIGSRLGHKQPMPPPQAGGGMATPSSSRGGGSNGVQSTLSAEGELTPQSSASYGTNPNPNPSHLFANSSTPQGTPKVVKFLQSQRSVVPGQAPGGGGGGGASSSQRSSLDDMVGRQTAERAALAASQVSDFEAITKASQKELILAITELKNQLVETSQRHQRTTEDLVKQNTSLKIRLTSTTSQLEKAETDNKVKLSDLIHLVARLKSTLQEQDERASFLMMEKDILLKEKQELQFQIGDMTVQYDDARGKLRDLQEIFRNVQQAMKGLQRRQEARDGEYHQLLVQNRDYELHVLELEQMLVDAHSSVTSSLEAKDASIARLQQELATTESFLHKLHAECVSHRGRKSEVEEELEAWRAAGGSAVSASYVTGPRIKALEVAAADREREKERQRSAGSSRGSPGSPPSSPPQTASQPYPPPHYAQPGSSQPYPYPYPYPMQQQLPQQDAVVAQLQQQHEQAMQQQQAMMQQILQLSQSQLSQQNSKQDSSSTVQQIQEMERQHQQAMEKLAMQQQQQQQAMMQQILQLSQQNSKQDSSSTTLQIQQQQQQQTVAMQQLLQLEMRQQQQEIQRLRDQRALEPLAFAAVAPAPAPTTAAPKAAAAAPVAAAAEAPRRLLSMISLRPKGSQVISSREEPGNGGSAEARQRDEELQRGVSAALKRLREEQQVQESAVRQTMGARQLHSLLCEGLGASAAEAATGSLLLAILSRAEQEHLLELCCMVAQEAIVAVATEAAEQESRREEEAEEEEEAAAAAAAALAHREAELQSREEELVRKELELSSKEDEVRVRVSVIDKAVALQARQRKLAADTSSEAATDTEEGPGVAPAASAAPKKRAKKVSVKKNAGSLVEELKMRAQAKVRAEKAAEDGRRAAEEQAVAEASPAELRASIKAAKEKRAFVEGEIEEWTRTFAVQNGRVPARSELSPEVLLLHEEVAALKAAINTDLQLLAAVKAKHGAAQKAELSAPAAEEEE